MAGKSNCCISATIRFLLDGRDGVGSGIGCIVRMVVVVVVGYCTVLNMVVVVTVFVRVAI